MDHARATSKLRIARLVIGSPYENKSSVATLLKCLSIWVDSPEVNAEGFGAVSTVERDELVAESCLV